MTSRILPRLWTAGLALATAVLGPQRLPAHSAAAAADARPVTSPRVEVSLVGSVAQDPEFRKLVEEWLGANDVAHVTRSLDSLELDDITRVLGIEGRAGSVAVGVFARLDWALIRTHYDVQTESGLVREFTRPLAQPGLVLDLVWSKDSRG